MQPLNRFVLGIASGFISISIDMSWMEPATTAAKDVEAAERAKQFIVSNVLQNLRSQKTSWSSFFSFH